MINVNRSDVARRVIGVILVGVGVSLLAGVLLYLSPQALQEKVAKKRIQAKEKDKRGTPHGEENEVMTTWR